MAYWLLKSEPGTWSWDDQLKKGDEGEGWDGVRNYQASNNMRKMEIGDLAFFYHSVSEKSIVGIVSIIVTPFRAALFLSSSNFLAVSKAMILPLFSMSAARCRLFPPLPAQASIMRSSAFGFTQ